MIIDAENAKQKQAHDQIVKFVDIILKLNKELQTTKLETQQQQIQRTISHSEKKIDELVYKLYVAHFQKPLNQNIIVSEKNYPNLGIMIIFHRFVP